MNRKRGLVLEVLSTSPELQELLVEVDGEKQRAYNYPLLQGQWKLVKKYSSTQLQWSWAWGQEGGTLSSPQVQGASWAQGTS